MKRISIQHSKMKREVRKMLQIQSRDSAVSPVVGVMLMLVVCIIVAAVVSGFVGGLAGDTGKGPQIALGAKVVYGTETPGTASKIAGYIVLTHAGGDSLAWENTEFRTYIPRGEFKGTSYVINYADDKAGVIYTAIGDEKQIYDSSTHTFTTQLFQSGDDVLFAWDVSFAENPDNPSKLMVPKQGEDVVLQLFDKVSGKMIVEKTVRVV